MLNGDNAPIRKTAAIARPVNVIDDRRRHVPSAQEIGVQRVCHPAVHRVLCGRQSLAEDLATENLWAAEVAAVATKYVVLDALKLQKRDQIL